MHIYMHIYVSEYQELKPRSEVIDFEKNMVLSTFCVCVCVCVSCVYACCVCLRAVCVCVLCVSTCCVCVSESVPACMPVCLSVCVSVVDSKGTAVFHY